MKRILFSIVLLSFALNGFAQQEKPGKPDREAVRKARVEFFNSELQLSDSEQADFWPAYEKFSAGLEELRDGKRKPRMDLMSDAEAQDFVDDYFVKEEKKLALRKELFQALSGNINVRKIAALPSAEHKFKRHLLQKVRQHRQGQGGGRERKF